jgi:hypothetical protein
LQTFSANNLPARVNPQNRREYLMGREANTEELFRVLDVAREFTVTTGVSQLRQLVAIISLANYAS